MNKRLKKLDAYSWGALVSLPLSVFLLIFLMTNNPSLLLDTGFLNVLVFGGFLGNMLSGSTYLGRAVDALLPQSMRPNGVSISPREKIGTLVGVVLGLSLGIALAFLTKIPLTTAMVGLTNIFFMVTKVFEKVGLIAGLGNRMGASFEKKPKEGMPDSRRLKGERYATRLAALFGALLGIFLLVTATTAAVSVIGLSSIFSGGAALPFWVAGIIFVFSASSISASSTDYTMKAINWARASRHAKKPHTHDGLKNIRETKKHEYRGAFAGVSTGVIIAIVVVTAVALAQPYVFAGVLGVITAIAIVATAISIFGGIFSRIGRVMDRMSVKAKEKTIPEEGGSGAASPELSEGEKTPLLPDEQTSLEPPSKSKIPWSLFSPIPSVSINATKEDEDTSRADSSARMGQNGQTQRKI